MLSTRAWVSIGLGAVAAMILLAIAGRIVGAERMVEERPALEGPIKAVVFGLFLVAGVSAMALMLKVFLAGQRRIGNEAHPLVRLFSEHETAVVAGFLVVVVAALALAVPAMIKDGFFGPAAARSVAAALRPRSAGVLVANVGMTLDEVRRRSTVPVPAGTLSVLDGSRTVIGDMVFDFEIADTGARFPGARYFFLVTRNREDPRLESMNVGVTPDALPRAEFDAFLRHTREQLAAAGWASGRHVYRTAEQQRLHGGKTSAGEGTFWLKGDTLVRFEPKRVDDEKPGEEPRTAGQWILALAIWDRAKSSYDNLEFTPP